jgi:uncharacterized protein YyaL (SSP411 family)
MFTFSFSIYASNKLANETSPYLLQHKNNPVNWYAWNNEAFKTAKKQNKLIFLSIGYSTCHWCHVMAEESFENNNTAKLLNDNYISIKIDKEQYPHIDKYYQRVYQLMNQKSGGWPLSIFMTTDKKPFYSATYIPVDDGYGQMGFNNLINKINTIPKKKLDSIGNNIESTVKNSIKTDEKIVKIDAKLAMKTINDLKKDYDFKYFGFSKNRKFPESNKIKLALKIYEMTKDKSALFMTTKALDTMAKSGIYDQVNGGFFRYTVDEKWQIPHFEKMLYTNAELLEVYTKAYKITNNKLYKKIVKNTIDDIDKRFQVNNVYQSASNADSTNKDGQNQEGIYFVFLYDEVMEYLNQNGYEENKANKHLQYLNITSKGNFEIDLSHSKITSNVKPKNIDATIKLLQKYRDKKKYPFIDNKINTSWNAMYLKAKLKASIIDKKFLKQALMSLDTLVNKMYIDEELYHQTIKNIKPKQKALLEDYAFLSSALFEAYQQTLDMKYFKLFEKLVLQSIDKFYKNNKWLESQDSFKSFANMQSSSYSSYLAINIQNIILYSSLKAKTKIYKIAKDTLDVYSYNINNYPSYYPQATLITLMQKYEPVFIKAKIQKLDKIDINSVDYPFVYRYEDKTELYLACKINTCFSFGNDFAKIKKDIESLF